MLVLGVALAGVLAPLLPIAAVGLILLIVLSAYSAASGHAGHARGMEALFSLLSAVLALAAAAKWRRVIRQGSQPPSLARRLRPLWLRLSRPGTVKRAAASAANRHDSRDRLTPVEIIRICLGGMFTRPTARAVSPVALTLIVALAAAFGLSWLYGRDGHWAVAFLVPLAAALVSSGFLAQISKLTRGELAELALLPGLGNVPSQRRALCRAVLAPPVPWLAAILASGSAALLWKGNPISSVAVLAVCLLVVWLTYTAYALQKLATFPPIRRSFISEFALLYLGLYAPLSLTRVSHWPWWVWLVPVFFSAGIAIAIAYSARRLATAPHPFLA